MKFSARSGGEKRFMFRALLATSAILAVAPFSAHAQEAPDSAEPVSNGDDIVVTAQRDKSLVSKTPIAMTAITGEALASKGVNDPLKLAALVPNLEINRFYGLQITIRGITSSNMFAQGDPSAAFLLDGVYIARPAVQDANFYDVERVEVLRGPQGTLYGRNSTAGVVNVISTRPTLDKVKGYLNASYGNYDALNLEGAINLPVSDTFALRVAGTVDRRDSYFSNVAGDKIDGNPFRDNKAIRGSALWQPTENLSIFLTADYAHMGGITQIVVEGSKFYDIATDPERPVYTADQYSTGELLNRGYAQGITPHVNDKIYGFTGEVNWNLGPVTATYIGSYRRYDQHQEITDYSGQVSPTYIDGMFEQNSHELRFALNDIDRLKFQFGGMYFEEKSRQHFEQPDYFGVPNFILDYNPTRATSYAFFGQGTYSLTDTLRLTGGLRYSHDHKDQLGWTILDYDAFAITLPNGADTSFSKVTWRVGVDADLNDHTMAYASVATGYKAGAFNDGCEIGKTIGGVLCTVDNGGRPADELYYQPETLTAYEMGIKGRLAGNLLSYDLAAFWYDYTNMQVGTVSYYSGAATSTTLNAAKARVKGIEASTILTPDARNRLALNLNWLDAKYRKWVVDETEGIDNSGLPLSRSPKWTGSVDYTYTLPLANGGSLVANGRFKVSSKYYLVGTSTITPFLQPGYTRTDLSLTYNAPGDSWFIQVYGRNLENKIQVTASTYFAGALAIIPSDPRTYGVRAGLKF